MVAKDNILTRFLDDLTVTFENQGLPLEKAPPRYRDSVEIAIGQTDSYLDELRKGLPRNNQKETRLQLVWRELSNETSTFDKELARQILELSDCFCRPTLEVDDLVTLVPTYFDLLRETCDFLGLEES